MRVELIAKTVSDALVIPQTAVLTAATGSTYAIVIDNDKKPHLRKISVGIRDSRRHDPGVGRRHPRQRQRAGS